MTSSKTTRNAYRDRMAKVWGATILILLIGVAVSPAAPGATQKASDEDAGETGDARIQPNTLTSAASSLADTVTKVRGSQPNVSQPARTIAVIALPPDVLTKLSGVFKDVPSHIQREGHKRFPGNDPIAAPARPDDGVAALGGGACCLVGDCKILSRTMCEDTKGGTFLGDGTGCDPNPCGKGGACCNPNLTSATSCKLGGSPFDCDFTFGQFTVPGAFRGYGTFCSADCPLCDGYKDVHCDWCWEGTDRHNFCPGEWFGDGECDCGCQYYDSDCGTGVGACCFPGDAKERCFQVLRSNCHFRVGDFIIPGAFRGVGTSCPTDCTLCDDEGVADCEWCWVGTPFENYCPESWCGDKSCDCGCQFNDPDCDDPPRCGGFLGTPCPDELTCIDDPSDQCDPAHGGADCGGICARSCGGFAGLPCPNGFFCVDDPSDDCKVCCDCPGLCVPADSSCNPETCYADFECPEWAFCDREESCYGQGICRPRYFSCPADYDPVCGCDGETYINRCEAHAAGVSVAGEGGCNGVCGDAKDADHDGDIDLRDYADFANKMTGPPQ